jgi:TBC1 domain family member 13
MLLMCQEFDMANVIRLWDTLFSDPDRFDYMNYVCVALVQLKKQEVLEGDFAVCMETLQRAADSVEDVRSLLNCSNNVCAKYLKKQSDYV